MFCLLGTNRRSSCAGLTRASTLLTGVAIGRCEDRDGRIKSGHDELELYKRHCELGTVLVANFPGKLSLSRE